MALNTNYMTSSDLDEYFVDKDTGLPLSNGKVTFYQDNQRTVLQNVYTLSGSPPNYTYTPLPNPLFLNATGEPVDASGNIVKIYYYPFDSNLNLSLYYVTVYSSGGVLQYTRQGWPNSSGLSSSGGGFGNYIENGQFLYNIGASANPVGVTALELAPSNNELLYGSVPAVNFSFQKSNTVVTDNITFNEVNPSLNIEGNPPYYCTYACTAVGAGGETFKQFVWNFKGANTFQNQFITFSLQASSSSSSTITYDFIQNFGTGGTPDAPVTVNIGTSNLTGTFTKYFASFRVPSTSGKNFGTNGNDYSAIVLNIPLNTICNISFTNVQFELSQTPSTYFIEGYDRVAALISKYSTGDVLPSIKPQKFGFLNMNDGTIGNPTSLATYANNITYALYCYLWKNFADTYAPARHIYNTGTASQSGTTLTGTGTNFTAAMVGGTVQFLQYTNNVGQASQGLNNQITGVATAFIPQMVGGTIQFTSGTYNTGTASQSGNLVTGVGTTWTAAMVGGTITIGANPPAEIDGFVNSTQLSVSTSTTIAATTYSISYGGQKANIIGYQTSDLIIVDTEVLVGINTFIITYVESPVPINAYTSPTSLTIGTSETVPSGPYLILYGSRGTSADSDFTNGLTIQLLYTTGRALVNHGNNGNYIYNNGQNFGSDNSLLEAQNFPTGLTFNDSGHTHGMPAGSTGGYAYIVSAGPTNDSFAGGGGEFYYTPNTGNGFANVGSPVGAANVPLTATQASIAMNFLIKL